MHVHRAASRSQSTRTDIGLLQFWRDGHEETGADSPVHVHGRPQCICRGRALRRRREKHPVLDIRRQHRLCVLAQAVSRRQLRGRCPPRRTERQCGRPGHDPCLYQRRNRRPVRTQPGPGLRADCDRPPCSACRSSGPCCCARASGGGACRPGTTSSSPRGGRRGAPRAVDASACRAREASSARCCRGTGTGANRGCPTRPAAASGRGSPSTSGTPAGSTASRCSPATCTTAGASGQTCSTKSRPASHPPGNLVLEEQQRCSGPEHLFRKRGIGYRDRQSGPGRFHAGQAEHCQ